MLALAANAGCGDDGGTEHDTEHDHTSTGADDAPSTMTMPGTMTADDGMTGSGTTPDPDDSGTTGDSGSGTADGTAGSDSSTGEPADVDVQLQFAVRVGEDDAVCGQTYDAGIGAGANSIQFRDIRFFVSDVRLVDGDGNEVPVTLEQDGAWQYENLALLDFEDGTGACDDQTTVDTNTTVRGTVPPADYTGIHFLVGIPFQYNHLDFDNSEPPLNASGMYWAWASGHKFMRIDIDNLEETAPENAWNFHLGAQGCTAPSPMEPPDEPCTRPGQPDIVLGGFDPAASTVVLDIGALFTNVDVTLDTAASPPGCMSFMPDADECDDLFPNLGLTWESGDCENGCSGQTAFVVQ